LIDETSATLKKFPDTMLAIGNGSVKDPQSVVIQEKILYSIRHAEREIIAFVVSGR
jgi:hypothetical protein